MRSRRAARARRDPCRTCSTRSWSPVFARIYEDAEDHWEAYETCEELVDLEENFQLWRFRHLKTVERTIGVQDAAPADPAGSPSCSKALELTFFPELYAVRTEIGS